MKQPSKPKLLLICKNFFVQANNLALLGDDFSVMKAVFFMDYAIEQMLNILIMDFGSDEDFKNHEIKWNTLWQKVTKAIKDETSIKMNRIPNYKQLKELRDIRNGLQHNGTIPRADQVSRLVNPAKEILSECFSKCYGFDLDN
ncbi:MAG: hypothetical protein GWN01_01090, partial [Nitrosopumilaceae archaeon]|nr:hypothetical protein [Nitrosopumilaceae archaeon]NIU85953.1 hypothetical protein [Nitrosopumilaceae archaeon]NIV64777.1 hypothetical protein [Nitrosopumilaceae archaeon]NIX60175.1 hypothetical protein [Nitrosopumilaceae archaeon]